MHPLESLIRKFDLAWMIDSFSPPDAALPKYLKTMEAANSESSARFGPNVLPVTVQALQEELEPHPYRVEAFLQALAVTFNPSMLLMSWSILSGWEIAGVSVTYDYCNAFSMRVILREDEDGADQIFDSDDITDAALLRHFGIARKSGKPYFDGFYALHLYKRS